jgi:tetratricopeptide (TPR) repeat protein
LSVEVETQIELQNWEQVEILYREIIALSKQKNGATVGTRRDLRQLYLFLDRWPEALVEAKLIVSDWPGLESMNFATALASEAKCSLLTGDVHVAQKAIMKAIQVLQQQLPYSEIEIGRCLVIRSACSIKLSMEQEAESDLSSAWSIFDPYLRTAVLAAVPDGVARLWATRALIMHNGNDRSGTISACEEAVKCRRQVVEMPQMCGPYAKKNLAHSIINLGFAYENNGNFSSANDAFDEAASIRAEVNLPPVVSDVRNLFESGFVI